MIYFDLDGVLRDLCKTAKISPKSYNEKIGPYEESFVEYISKRKHILTIAEPTQYLDVATFIHKELDIPITILSNQVADWVTSSTMWIEFYFSGKVPPLILSADKLSYLKDEHDILIEDYPFFDNYNKILLIDQPYNKDIQLPHTRIYSAFELLHALAKGGYL